MKKANLPVITIALALIVGIVIYDVVFVSLKLLAISIAVLITILFTLHRLAYKKPLNSILFTTAFFCLFTTIGYLTSVRKEALTEHNHYSHIHLDNEHTFLFSINEVLKPTLYQDKFIVTIKTIDGKFASGRALLNISHDSILSHLDVGQWYYTRTTLSPVPYPKNPYQFDYGKYLKRKQIYGQFTVNSSNLLMSKNTSRGINVWSSRFRASLQQALHSYSFTSDQRAVIDALILGQRSGIDKQMNTQYAAAGMMHILAVSGLHVGIILLLLRFITSPITSRKLQWLRSIVIIILIWGFAFITGLSPSVMRAATMFSFLEIGQGLSGKRKTTDAVFASAIFLLLYNPLLIYQVGFQLSYLAVLGILWIQPWLSNFYTPRYKLDKLFWGIFTVSIAAQLGVLPLSLFYFHQFPGLFFISNIVILPFLGIILGCGIIVVTLAFIGQLPEQAVLLYGYIIDTMNSFIFWIANKESFIAKHITISITLLIVSYLCIISIILLLKKFEQWRLIAASVTIVMFTSVIIFEKTKPTPSHLTVFNKSKSTMLGILNNSELKIYSNDSLSIITNDYRVLSYKDGTTVNKLTTDSVRNYFRFKQKDILIIDSLGIYQLAEANPDYILLTQSPKININRLTERFPKAQIIADASNYKSYVERWRATCVNKKIPFHSTYEKGSYIVK